MAKEDKKPASTPKGKKAEPVAKKVAKAKVKKEEPVKKEEVKETPVPKKSREFPKDCKHPSIKRKLGPRNRVMHVCVSCGKVVKVGGR